MEMRGIGRKGVTSGYKMREGVVSTAEESRIGKTELDENALSIKMGHERSVHPWSPTV